MRPLTILSLLCMLAPVCPASAARYAHRPFVTGEAFLAFSPAGRESYATGILDDLLTAPYLGAPLARAAQLNACLGSKSDAELAGLLSDYLRQHAEERRYEMPSVTLRALTALCGAEPPP